MVDKEAVSLFNIYQSRYPKESFFGTTKYKIVAHYAGPDFVPEKEH